MAVYQLGVKDSQRADATIAINKLANSGGARKWIDSIGALASEHVYGELMLDVEPALVTELLEKSYTDASAALPRGCKTI